MPKLVRDLAILFAFCGAFYFLVVLVRGESTKPPSSSNFSRDRIEGDRLMQEENWEKAILYFERISENDKYNGLAIANICRSKIALLNQNYVEYLEKSELSSVSEDQKAAMREEVDAKAESCIEPLQKLAKFDQHKGRALRKIAAIHCFLGNDETAVDYLEKYLLTDDPYGLPIYRDATFDTLRYLDKFHDLIETEWSKHQTFRFQ